MSRMLQKLIEAYPVQPATAYWRAIELDAVIRGGLPDGFGLDLGCGDGKLTEILLHSVGDRRFVGVDADPLEAAEAGRRRCYERVHAAEGAHIPEHDASFDFVFSNSVLEHIVDIGPVLNEVSRLLRTGGQFVFTVPAAGFREHLRGSLLPWIPRGRYLRELDRRIVHLRYPSSQEWEAMLAGSGMKLEETIPYMTASQVRRWESLHRFTGGLLSVLAGDKIRPIDVQRRTGMRQFQNRRQLPKPVARILAQLLTLGQGNAHVSGDGAVFTERNAGCLLVKASRS